MVFYKKIITEKYTPSGYKVSLDDYLKLDKEQKTSFLQEIVYQSNLIEGIVDYWVYTAMVGDKPKPLYELVDHAKAYKYLLKNYDSKAPTQDDIKETHRLLMQNLDEGFGKYRTKDVFIGGFGKFIKGTPKPKYLPELMDELENDIINLNNPSEEDIWKIHYKYEIIHPHSDGNGRNGRILLNWLSLRHLKEFIVIDQREEYIKGIKEYTPKFEKEHPNIVFLKKKDLSKKRLAQMEEERKAIKQSIIKLIDY